MDLLEFIAALAASLAWPAVAVGAAFFFRGSIKAALQAVGDRRLKRLKAGPIEAEWEEKVQQALIDVAESPDADPAVPVERSLLSERLAELAASEPRGAVLTAYAEVEEALRRYLTLAGLTEAAERPMSARQLARIGAQRELLDPEIANAVEGATVLRNLAAHGPGDELDPAKAADYLYVADGVLFAIEAKARSLRPE